LCLGPHSRKEDLVLGIHEVHWLSSLRFMASFQIPGPWPTYETFTTRGSSKARTATRSGIKSCVSVSGGGSPWRPTSVSGWSESGTAFRARGLATKEWGASTSRPTRCQPDVSMITRDDVEDWISELERSGVHAPTIDKAFRTLRACLETAIMQGKAGSTPAQPAAPPGKRFQAVDGGGEVPPYTIYATPQPRWRTARAAASMR